MGNEKILIIRNPISVALSKGKMAPWHSTSELDFLLETVTDVQQRGQFYSSQVWAGTKFLEFILIWCTIYRFLLKRYQEYRFTLVYYEELLRNPETAIEKLFSSLELSNRFWRNKDIILTASKKLSGTTNKPSNKIDDNLRLDTPWSGELSEQEIARAYEILKDFQLYDIYENSIVPKLSKAHLVDLVSTWK